ncbi:hypothetical protein BDA96_04G120300 [Sorghum bicolor]|jgi:hypothetical protein|uniref:Uncharacterized protein n=2 Tax=Sorghum bicolor TaxID=4558 RepID=A0A921R5N7_SORBI|nr:hypothetical protein SORBI_3004G111900 [Sorghum bicolor]KAG0532590.1 hypothetical protein BDA96_04G120300 [Sorghum bicolor]
MYRGIDYERMVMALSFNSTRFNESTKKVLGFCVTMGSASRPIKLSVGSVWEFTAENEVGKFDVELKLDTVLQYKGRKAKCPLMVICLLKL